MNPDLIAYLHEQFARLHLRLDELVRWTADAGRHLTAIEQAVRQLQPSR